VKICICTTPIRPTPTAYPPFGSMAVIQSLRGMGDLPVFYNIDYFRYTPEQIETWFREQRFDLVGISAVVSTAYAYTKWLALLVRRVSPMTVIVVGGNLAASAEILLRKCHVDFCVSGDGEIVIRDLVQALKEHSREGAKDVFAAIPGICFLEEDGRFTFTGFGQRPTVDQLEFPDYSLFANDGSLSHFINDTLPASQRTWTDDPLLPQVRTGKRATLVTAKGCVARCTFCHRWEKGYRALSVDRLVGYIVELKERYGVSHLDIGDENFGSDRELTHELASKLGELGVTWIAGGVRTKTVKPDDLVHWRRNGCIAAYFGIESGSSKILEIMEKNATVEDNINALQWVAAAGISTIVQLVIGMPGETDETIEETIEFLKRVSDFTPDWADKYPSELCSVNYAQALPGTPLYEWAREHGYIGQSIDDEERYLLKISDTDAYAEDHFINYTGLPLLKVLMWRPIILAEIDAYHAVRKGWYAQMSLAAVAGFYSGIVWVRLKGRLASMLKRISGPEWMINKLSSLLASERKNDFGKDISYFNIHSGLKFAPLLLNRVTRSVSYPLIALAVAFWRGGSIGAAAKLLTEHVVWIAKGRPVAVDLPNKSLRKVVAISGLARNVKQGNTMIPLRLGR